MRRASLLLSLFAVVVSSAAAIAQDTPSVSPVPAGDATLRGVVEHPGPGGVVSGLEVVLYSLASDGRPGVSRMETSADGRFAFEQITNASDTVFLLAIRYGEIPFGQRILFEPGELVREVRIEVSDPVSRVEGLSIVETRVLVEPQGAGVRVRVNHRFMSKAERVAHVGEDARAKTAPLFTGWLPAGASDFRSAMMSLGDGLERRDDRVLFWGPLYPGDQEIQYEYSLAASDQEVSLVERAGVDTSQLLVTLADTGSELRSTQLVAEDDVEIEGRSFRAYVARDIAAGDSVAWSLQLPDFRSDVGALAFSDATLWLELDDTNLVVNEELKIEVAPGSSLMAAGDELLFELELPAGAELTGVSPALSAIGTEPTDTGFGVRGPVPAGETTLAFRYRIASSPEGLELSLRFPRELAVLRLLVADTGVAIGSDRLHRRRAIRSGTRMYLYNEAFRVAADEEVRVSLEPIAQSGSSSGFAIAATGLLGLLSMLAVLAPLRPGRGAEARGVVDDELDAQRERVYASIRDLDHDFETGKLARDDYDQTRLDLKAEAVALLKQQRDSVKSDPASDQAPTSASAPESEPARASAPPAATGEFCSGCGHATDRAWKFCSSCGAALAAAQGDE